jgi:DNA helicase-2/ATP-dependent DNA helicase PcrA
VRYGKASKPVRRRATAVVPRPASPRQAAWDDDIQLDPEYAHARKVRTPEFDPLDVLEDDSDDSPVVVYDEPASTRVYVGMRVRHAKWGVGSVIGWSGNGAQMKLNLRFPSGSRTILASFCEVIG